jgi:hypothetical protein
MTSIPVFRLSVYPLNIADSPAISTAHTFYAHFNLHYEVPGLALRPVST